MIGWLDCLYNSAQTRVEPELSASAAAAAAAAAAVNDAHCHAHWRLSPIKGGSHRKHQPSTL